VIDPNQAVERIKDARKIGGGHSIEQLRGKHARNVIQQKDALHTPHRVGLGPEPPHDRLGQCIEQLCDRIALDLKRNHQFADSQQPARDCQGTSCRNHADRCAFSEQTGMRLLVEVKRERHEAIFVGVSGNHPVQCSEAAAHRGDGRWAIVVPHHLGAERRRFGGHPILDPETGDPCHIGETLQDLEVDTRPELRQQKVVERIDARVRRQPWTVNDQCNRYAIRRATCCDFLKLVPCIHVSPVRRTCLESDSVSPGPPDAPG